jgi:hypothetical protein
MISNLSRAFASSRVSRSEVLLIRAKYLLAAASPVRLSRAAIEHNIAEQIDADNVVRLRPKPTR